MIDWNKPLETTTGLPIMGVVHNYHLGAGVKRTMVIVREPARDVIHFVDRDGKSNYADHGGIDVRNVSE
jgi:hypothetical protein